MTPDDLHEQPPMDTVDAMALAVAVVEGRIEGAPDISDEVLEALTDAADAIAAECIRLFGDRGEQALRARGWDL